MDALKIISQGSIKTELPEFNIGDTVRVSVNIKEGDRERIQMFEGTVIARKGSGVAETFTVRRVSYGVGVALSVFSRYIHPTLLRLSLFARVKSAEQSFIICVTELVKLLKLKKKFVKLRGLCPFFYLYLFCKIHVL